MTTILGTDETANVDLAESGRKRSQDRVACFLHLRDLVYLHPGAASASAVTFVQSLEASVIAEQAARDKRLADMRERGEGRRAPPGVKAAPGQGKAQKERPRPWSEP